MMEKKKNEKYDLEQKRHLFFGVGMIISIAMALVAFEWRSPIDPIVSLPDEGQFVDETLYIPPTTVALPPPPKLKALEIIEVKEEPEEEKLPNIDVDIPKDEEIAILIPTDIPDEVVVEAPRSFAEVMPSYEGGMENFYKLIADNIMYPTQAKRLGVEGKVFVEFIVEKDGTLSNIKAVKGIGAGCDEEAVRVMKLASKFTPARQGDVRVRLKMIVPIRFQLH